MSTFVMDVKGYDKLAGALYDMATGTTWQNEGQRHAVLKFLGLEFGDDTAAVKERIQLRVNNLISANNHAYDERYGTDCEFEHKNPHEWYCTTHNKLKVAGTEEPNSCESDEYYWEYKSVVTFWPLIQVIKNLECLQYQLAEGSVYKSEIYNMLDELINGLSRAYVHNQSAYNDARWGW